MLPSVLPKLGTDSAVRRFPGVWKLLSFYPAGVPTICRDDLLWTGLAAPLPGGGSRSSVSMASWPHSVTQWRQEEGQVHEKWSTADSFSPGVPVLAAGEFLNLGTWIQFLPSHRGWTKETFIPVPWPGCRGDDISLFGESPTYEWVPFQEHIHNSSLFMNPTKFSSVPN